MPAPLPPCCPAIKPASPTTHRGPFASSAWLAGPLQCRHLTPIEPAAQAARPPGTAVTAAKRSVRRSERVALAAATWAACSAGVWCPRRPLRPPLGRLAAAARATRSWAISRTARLTPYKRPAAPRRLRGGSQPAEAGLAVACGHAQARRSVAVGFYERVCAAGVMFTLFCSENAKNLEKSPRGFSSYHVSRWLRTHGSIVRCLRWSGNQSFDIYFSTNHA